MNLLVSSRRRILAGVALAFLLAPLPLLAQPSARTTPSMVYDEENRQMILFGGVSPAFTRGDQTGARLFINETWLWTNRRWIQIFPASAPSGRGGFVFVRDSVGDRSILFGGVGQDGLPLGDTWAFSDGEWSQISTPSAPPARKYAAGTFDIIRNKVILFGGYRTDVTTDADGDEVRTDVALRDTWEFDGTTWVKTADQGPEVTASVLVYDGTRDQTLMVGMKADSTSVMYRYTGAGWEPMTPEKLPVCLSRSVAVWQSHAGNVLLYGGACGTGAVPGATWEWNGTNWTAVEGSSSAGRIYGHAMAYDESRGETILFGGTDFDISTETNFTYKYRGSKWTGIFSPVAPGPRSLFGFTTDPQNNAVWLYGGVRGSSDFWKYSYGRWTMMSVLNQPSNCSYPLTAWDSDRKVLVLVCGDASVKEFNGTEWKTLPVEEKRPITSIQASLVYDPTLKKTILYGGYGGNYLNETWTWDGAKWTEVDGKHADYRALASMFYDPISKKTILYGGIGRETRDGALVRFADTWSFNGKDWVEMTGAASPPARYGAAVAYNPGDNKVHMLGGTNEVVELIDEHYTWDGTRWTKVDGGIRPPARMNARLAWDPTLEQFVLFGGFGGYYFSDLWVLEGSSWHPVALESPRRRTVSLAPGTAGGSAAAPAVSRGRVAARP